MLLYRKNIYLGDRLNLFASKDEEVVVYVMSRTMSPMMVSQYQLQLPGYRGAAEETSRIG